MAKPLIPLLRSVEEKIMTLTDLCSSQAMRIKELEQENQSLTKSLQEKELELNKTRQDAEFLIISHKLADSPDNIINTRRHIARLIRTIDNCILKLKED